MGDNRSAEQKASAPSTPSASPSASAGSSNGSTPSSSSSPTPPDHVPTSPSDTPGLCRPKSNGTPSPSPGPDPNHPKPDPYVPSPNTRNNPGDVENKKKIAMDAVVSEFNSARSSIGADYDHTGAKSPSDKHIQSTGLGTDASVWKSTLANTKREEIAGALNEITREFNWNCEDCFQDPKSEPDWVPSDDVRAKWTC